MKERENVLVLCNQILNDTQEIISNRENHEMIRKVAELLHNRAKEINNICAVEKYDLYFNGTAGEGKTSAISSLFNLIDKDAKTKHEFPLLKTSPGRTTPCETVIMQDKSDISTITIDKLDNEEFEKILCDYCFRFYDKQIPLSEECSRIIDNMLKLKVSDTQEEKLKSLIDRMESNENNKELILDYAIKYIAYNNRTTEKIILDPVDLRRNLKKTLADVSSGKREDCPYPKKIIINISEKEFSLNIPSFINRIIDTKGIDSPERKDIQDAIKDKKNIVIMCDNIKSIAGNENVLSIMRNVLIKENKDDSKRTFYLGLEQGKQLSDADENNNDREIGMKIKKGQCVNKFNTNKIFFLDDNILFFNSFKGLTIKDGSDIVAFDEEENNKEINSLINNLKLGLNRMYLSYSDELSVVLKNVNALKLNKISDKTFENFSSIQSVVNDMKSEIKREYDIINNIRADVDTRHAGKVRAMVNRDGSYESCNIYEISEKLGGEEFASITLSLKDKLVGRIQGIVIDDEIEAVCMDTLISKVENEYLSAYRKNQKYYYDYVNEIMNKPKPWSEPRLYWGDGKGRYRTRVVTDIENYLRSNLLNQSNIYEVFLNSISDFLNF